MPLITIPDLENAKRDADDLALIVGGSATRANSPQVSGTVTTRSGVVVKTLAKTVADIGTTGNNLLTPIVYNSTSSREAALATVTLGQLAYDRETTIIYQAVKQGTNPREWVALAQIDAATVANAWSIYNRSSADGRITVNDAELLRTTDELTRLDAVKKNYIKWPGGATTLNGLALGLNEPTWPTLRYGQMNVDFSYRIPFGDLLAKETHPTWTVDTTRIRLINGSNPLVRGYNLTNGHVDQTADFNNDAYIEDCYISGGYTKLYCVGQNDAFHPVYISNCEMTQFVAEGVNLQYGIIRNCYIHGSKADGLKINTGPVVVDGNFIRLLGQIEPTAHGDCIQTLDLRGATIIRNTLYMPGTGTIYDEATNGSTQCLRLVAESSAYEVADVLAAGNLMFGGGYTLSIKSRYAGSLVENIMIVNNVFGGPDYYIYGAITADHYASSNPGTIRNVIMWGNFTEHDGQPIKYGGVDQNGIWHFSKEHANERFLEVGKRVGLLDWNGDLAPGVTSRTNG